MRYLTTQLMACALGAIFFSSNSLAQSQATKPPVPRVGVKPKAPNEKPQKLIEVKNGPIDRPHFLEYNAKVAEADGKRIKDSLSQCLTAKKYYVEGSEVRVLEGKPDRDTHSFYFDPPYGMQITRKVNIRINKPRMDGRSSADVIMYEFKDKQWVPMLRNANFRFPPDDVFNKTKKLATEAEMVQGLCHGIVKLSF